VCKERYRETLCTHLMTGLIGVGANMVCHLIGLIAMLLEDNVCGIQTPNLLVILYTRM